MALSGDFKRNILEVLDDAEGCISTEKIAQILSEEEGRTVPTGRVRPFLKHALEKYVEQKPSDRWNIASPHHGKFSPRQEPASGDEAIQSGSEQEDTGFEQEDVHPEQGDDQKKSDDELSSAILQVLDDADTPLSSRRIAERAERVDTVSSTEIEFIETQVNRLLRFKLSTDVEKDNDNLWRLADREYNEASESGRAVDEKDAEADQKPDPGPPVQNGATEGQSAGEDPNLSDQRSADGASDQRAEVEEQESSSEGGTPQGATNELDASLSDLEKSILSVQNSSEGWGIASSYRGEFSFSEGVTSGETGDGEDNDQLDELSQLILQELSEASSSLKVRHIAERISEGLNDVSPEMGDGIKTEVNRRLHGKLSTRVEADDGHWWRLSEDVQEESPVPDSGAPEESVRESDTQNSGASHTDEVSGDISEKQDEEDEPETTTPSGVAAEVGDKLETARQITFLLDLARSPLSVSSLTSLLKARGREVTEEDVRQRLESTLVRFVAEEEGKYHLKKDFDDSSETASGSASPAESTEERGTEQNPVDAATRASVSGRQYDYVFESHEMENACLFTSQLRGGTVTIKLNASHTAFDHFDHILNGRAESKSDQVENQYQSLIRLLIVSWTEVEGDLSGRRGELAEEIRDDWGRALRFLLRERDEE